MTYLIGFVLIIFVMIKQLYTLISILLIAISSNVYGQFPNEGRPLSWTFSDAIIQSLEVEKLQISDVPTLLEQDEIAEMRKEHPYRFANPISTDFDLQNSGRWIPLGNGDRVWLLSIKSLDAYSLAATLENVKIPQKAKLYIYNEDRTQFIGGFTYENLSGDILGLNHLSGNKFFIEYFEPYEVRGRGKLTVTSVSHAYKPLHSSFDSAIETSECFVNSGCNDYKDWNDPINSVVRITVDNGSRYCTGTLLNTTSNKSTAYVLTSVNSLIGDPESWVFTFRYESISCERLTESTKTVSFAGARVVAISENTNLALLELNSIPQHKWDVYYSGWNRNISMSSEAITVHHSHGGLKKICLDSEGLELVENLDLDVFEVDSWDEGNTLSGAIGSPLFDEDGLLIGVFSSGDIQCDELDNYSKDYFVSFAECWDDFKNFLDPRDYGIESLTGRPPSFKPEDEGIIEYNIAVFPNPAKEFINVYNNNDEIIIAIKMYDSTGKLVLIESEVENSISLRGIPPGLYLIELNLETFSVRERVIIQ